MRAKAISPQPASAFGEVVEANTTTFVAQCFEPERLTFPPMPALGSWTRSQDEETGNLIYGVVCYAAIAPIDTVHRARALGLSPQELREQQPQIFAMLRTDFRAAIVGFVSGGRVYQYLPPRPPQIHQPVYLCSDTEVREFCRSFEFLRTLLRVNGIPTDELVAAVIRQTYRILNRDRNWLLQAGRQLSSLLRDDYEHLSAILRKIEA
ncbi:hypothetical protein NW813_08030 [Synechococcus sp. R55.6]|jgi:hypothetical protein|uniref:hypothetical protein n=2 Tax=Synechococcus TaxID=1129 RepID=UPI0039C14EF8